MKSTTIVKESRRTELLLRKELLSETVGILETLSGDLTTAINNAAIDGTLRKEQLQSMKTRVDEDVNLFKTALEKTVSTGIEQATQVILDRNGQLYTLATNTAPPSGDQTGLLETLRKSASKPGGIYSVEEKKKLFEEVVKPKLLKLAPPTSEQTTVFFNGQKVKGQFVNTDPTLIWGYPVDHNFKVANIKTELLVSTGNVDKDSVGYRILGELPVVETVVAKTVIGQLHDQVLAEVFSWKGKDGILLSDRIWRLGEETKRDITNRLTQGILLGESHTKVAKDIRQYVNGTGGVKYKAERLVLTEFSRAYQTANEMAVNAMRQESDYEWFEKWELSPFHPRVDVCDILATQDVDGEGPGVYRKAPYRHPGCYCYIYPVYRQSKTKRTYSNVSTTTPNPTEASQSDKLQANKMTI